MTLHEAEQDLAVDGEPTTTVRVSGQDELDVWITGEGTPVVLSHGASWPDLLAPLMAELAKEDGYQLIRYHRRGYSGRPTGPYDIPTLAGDIVEILDELEIDNAHMFGHSYSAHIVLELLTQSPDRVRSAVLAEHGFGFQTEAEKEIVQSIGPAVAKYESGDKRGAATTFFAPIGASKDLIDQIPPEGIDTFFQRDVPAAPTWTLDLAKLEMSETPIAWMYSSEALPPFREAGEALQERVPRTRAIEIADSDHFFPLLKAAKTAAALHEWFVGQDAAN